MKELFHHGIKGQKWGVRNGPPYPLTKFVSRKAKDTNDIYKTLSYDEKAKVTGNDVTEDFIKQEDYVSAAASFILKYKDVPVSAFDIWKEKDGEVAVSVLTRSGDEYRNKGYATKAVKRGMEWIENHPEINTVYWDVRKDNVASIALAKKFGFEQMKGDGKDPAWTAYWKRYKRG